MMNTTLEQRADFAQDHWALWSGLLGFLAPQLSPSSGPAIVSLCALLCFFLALWLKSKSRCFKSTWPLVLIIAAPLASSIQLRNFGTQELQPGTKGALFTLCELRGSTKERFWLSGVLKIETSSSGDVGQSVRLSLSMERNNLDISSGRWRISGILSKKPFSSIWQFTSPFDEIWSPAPTFFSRWRAKWALGRYRAKTAVLALIANALPVTRARAFIAGLLTGQQPDLRLGHLLSRVGLAHLMAVSGFHFACVLAASDLLLRALRLHHPAALLMPLAAYFAYMGPSASVFRAAVMGVCRIISRCRKRAYRPLQGLGIGLLLWSVLWPECTGELGFLLSYLCTGALLLLMRPIEQLLCALWPPLRGASKQPRLARIFINCRGILSANVSAHLATAAPQLYFWHFFPIASIWYNLLLPPCIGLIMPFLLLACGLSLFWPALGRGLLQLAHAALTPLIQLTDVARPWECLIWAECGIWAAAWVSAGLLVTGLVWHERSYGTESLGLENWVS